MRNIYVFFADCLANWKWPARIFDTNLASMFSDDRADKHRKAQHIKGQASDVMSIMGVLLHFTRTVLVGICSSVDERNACEAFIALAVVCELIAETARSDVDQHYYFEKYIYFWSFCCCVGIRVAVA